MLRNWEQPEVSIPGSDQKDPGLWGRELFKKKMHRKPVNVNSTVSKYLEPFESGIVVKHLHLIGWKMTKNLKQ